ncbi:hypothetical protein JTB14_031815 [Gonioctena quinquepunctata]|nr:hypothetical protein JTB14_031815 [Gonioctena quinquepunctata]
MVMNSVFKLNREFYMTLRVSCLADIVEKNNEEDYDNLEDLEHADEASVESEYIVKPGYLQVIQGISGDGSDVDVGEIVRDADDQSEEIPTDQLAVDEENAERGNELLIKI